MSSDEERHLNALHTRQKLELLEQQEEQQKQLKLKQQQQLKVFVKELQKRKLPVVKRKSLLPTIEEKHSSSSKSRDSSPRVATPRVATPRVASPRVATSCPYCFRRTGCTGKRDKGCVWHELESLFNKQDTNKVAR
jgi:hypothetical protein